MALAIITSPRFSDHLTPPGHPERVERHEVMLAIAAEFREQGGEVLAPRRAADEDLLRVHDADYVALIRETAGRATALDPDTFTSPETYDVACLAAGAVVTGVDHVLHGGIGSRALALVRPPGHHAGHNRAMGFCFFNNVAVATAYLRSRGDRVAVLDWDVHHGNGTQAMLGDDPGALYVSIHQDHFYPFEGAVGDIDTGDAAGTVVNVPLPAGTGGDVYREAWSSVVIPVVTQFAPDWVLVSAGFDAHARDDLADLRLTNTDYGWMASLLAGVHPVERTIFALEGGYDLEALRASARSTLLGLAGHTFDGPDNQSPPYAGAALVDARDAVARYWAV